ncbi:hypothetical protein [Alkalibacillus haloalkaliphilus]|uniref:Uncharacterized protein n=1 Tax=Alkalibacillus haloalkaliphilus TaxID=94136 RepID=A0A511W1X1_9BACI|nr:hypothetical protein [Alkalibacillus haloalkaliphilus]GEN45056.1 hypothetical protein AHA02nite_08320 [Alkalibacillus haloalkaliphilus]
MGFFDHAKEMVHIDLELSELERNLKKAYKHYHKVNQRLADSKYYRQAKFEKVQEALQQFKDYFIERDFHLSDSNVYIVATLGQRRAELVINDTLDLTLRVYSHDEIVSDHTLFLEDKNKLHPKFTGQILNDQVKFDHSYSNLTIQERYIKSIGDVEQDIQALNERLKQDYKPDFLYYDVISDERYEELTDLLNYLNEELE